jgi:hypothetical protein
MQLIDRLRASFISNPAAWFLAVMLTYSIYGNYERDRELSRVCELLGPHKMSFANPITANEEIDIICSLHGPDNREPAIISPSLLPK